MLAIDVVALRAMSRRSRNSWHLVAFPYVFRALGVLPFLVGTNFVALSTNFTYFAWIP